ncbi:RsmB/NOP family class I SAM-dependent RNA methyltransferase [Candidatus Woesearchaeota archaeon]|nr:RsmB/NOP family class I SAM-dependent RNA methyltransferase [Candidatus Woesearchaeota archaeon]
MKLELKKEFIEKYSKLTNFTEYENIINKFLRKAIRINALKTTIAKTKRELSKKYRLVQIPWCKEGFWIETERRDLGNILEHQLGHIYIQEAASMLPPIILNPRKNEIILDAAASPGSKTTQIASMMKNTGLIIANDLIFQRMLPLSHNLQRCGVSNTITTIMDARFIDYKFDKILLDAPCSGTGTIRGLTQNSFYTIQTYSQNKVNNLSKLQKKLILKCYSNLKPKGTLVYSTCSLDPEEDEEVIQFLLNNSDAKLEKIDLKVKSELNLNYNNYSSELKKCIKLWPQFYDTEGFFIAKIKKP